MHIHAFFRLEIFFSHFIFKYFPASFSLSYPSQTPIMHMLVCLMVSYRSLKFCSFLLILFSFCPSDWIISIVPLILFFFFLPAQASYGTNHPSRMKEKLLVVKNPSANADDVREAGSISGSGRCPGEGNGNPLQYSHLENSMDRGALLAVVHRVTESNMTEACR